MALVKCNECGNQVSTLASTCPSCGYPMGQTLVECPDCNEMIPENADFCPKCHVIQVKKSATGAKVTIPVKKKGWSLKKKLLLALGATVFLAYLTGHIGNQSQQTLVPVNTTGPRESVSKNEAPPTGGSACNVPMKDGSYEMTRCNDLEELSKDWLFFRKQILVSNREGNKEKADKYRRDFEQTNRWLSKYKDTDVTDTIARFEGQQR